MCVLSVCVVGGLRFTVQQAPQCVVLSVCVVGGLRFTVQQAPQCVFCLCV